MVVVFILARNYREAVFAAKQHKLESSAFKRWHFLNSVEQLFGCTNIRVIYHGAYYEHPNYLEIAERIRFIEKIGKVERIGA